MTISQKENIFPDNNLRFLSWQIFFFFFFTWKHKYPASPVLLKPAHLDLSFSPALSGQLAAGPHRSLTVLKGVWHFDKSFWVVLHYYVSCWVLWWPVSLFGVLCPPSRQFHCYLGPARLAQESYKWALRNVIARVRPYTTFILMNKTWGSIYRFWDPARSIRSLCFCLCFPSSHKNLKIFFFVIKVTRFIPFIPWMRCSGDKQLTFSMTHFILISTKYFTVSFFSRLLIW